MAFFDVTGGAVAGTSGVGMEGVGDACRATVGDDLRGAGGRRGRGGAAGRRGGVVVAVIGGRGGADDGVRAGYRGRVRVGAGAAVSFAADRADDRYRLRQFEARRARLDQSPFRPFSKRAWTSAIVDRGNSCIRWPDRDGPVQRTSGPFADVPVLVTSGDLDPNVPTAEGRLAARQFEHARLVEVPNAGHVPEQEATGCAMSITIDFIRNQRLGDTSCLARIPPVPVG